MAEPKSGLFTRLSLFAGDMRGLFVPFGLFALLAAGIHVGTDRLDDHLFVLFNLIDGWVDESSAYFIKEIASWFDASAQTVDMLSFRAADLIDLELKQSAARLAALVLELAADFVLALPVFLYRNQTTRARELLELVKKTFADPTLLKLALPTAAVCAGLAGAFVVSREVQVLAHSLVSDTGLRPDLAALIASVAGFLALAVIVFRLGVVVTVGAISYAERRNANDRTMSVRTRERLLRGAITALVAVPIAVLAIAATPIAGTVRALLWM